MAEDKERLSSSAAKGKRNLLFLAVLAWALAFGWVYPRTEDTKVSLGGIGLETTIGIVLWGLALLLAYNLFSFWLHGPFSDRQAQKRMMLVFDPEDGATQGVLKVYNHLVNVAGSSSLPDDISNYHKLADWLNKFLQKVGKGKWDSSIDSNATALRHLWKMLSWGAKMRLRWAALRWDISRRALLEDAVDVWFPLVAGISGLLAVAIAFWRLA